MTEETPHPKPAFFGWIKSASDLRDGFLIVIAGVYAFGFLTWSISAWKRDLGFISLIDSQYFISGIIPGLVIISSIISYQYFNYFFSYERFSKFRLIVIIVLNISAVASIFIIANTFNMKANDSKHFFLFIFWSICILATANLSFVKHYDFKHLGIFGGPLSVLIIHFNYNMFVIAAVIIAIYAYISFVFSVLPQELGGGKLRYADIDIINKRISLNSINDLYSTSYENSKLSTEYTDEVVRIRGLKVFYDSSTNIIFAKVDHDGIERIFKIGQDAVSLISWIDSEWPSEIEGNLKPVDGDTLKLNDEVICLHGIDAPEIGQNCLRNGEAWSCGQAATNFLADMIKGKTVTCQVNERDRYNRLLAVCYVNGEEINKSMVSSGYALAYQRYSLDYVDDEVQAQEAKRGLWASQFDAP